MENKDWLNHARQKGLYIMTYGLQNNDPRWVAEQEMLGVHGVIVDDVVGICQSFLQRS
jgi:glycerophosphoryl diester phosphodiesterase